VHGKKKDLGWRLKEKEPNRKMVLLNQIKSWLVEIKGFNGYLRNFVLRIVSLTKFLPVVE
jgi:hypothetical protein